MMDISDKMIKLGELSVDEYLDGKSIYIMDVNLSPELSKFFIERMCSIKDLAEMYRICIWTEDYEGAYELSKEINKRGYVITIDDKSLNIKPSK